MHSETIYKPQFHAARDELIDLAAGWAGWAGWHGWARWHGWHGWHGCKVVLERFYPEYEPLAVPAGMTCVRPARRRSSSPT